LERNGRRRWCAIMAMKVAVSEGDRAGSDQGGGVLRPLWERKGEGHREAAATHELAVASSWPSGRRRKTKGWGARVCEGEGEGRAGPSRPAGRPRPKRSGGRGRADRPKAKAQAAGLKI
jgi:hypothetical protein